MSSTLQRISTFACSALMSTALVACGGSDSSEATGQSLDQVQEAVSGAGEMASDAVGSAGAMAKEAVEGAGSAAKNTIESASAQAKGAVVAASAGPDLAAGEKTYGRFCFSCHAAGVAGAPKLGDAEAWAPRTAKGLDMLVASTIEGIPPGMPARGLCMNCSDDELRNTVAWMIAQ